MAGPITLYFDPWPAATPDSGAALGELTQAFDKSIQKVLSATGMGQFSINRHDSQAAWCAYGNLVRVRTEAGGPFAWNDARYKFAFYIENRNDEIVSPDEEAGDVWTRGGRGILSVLEQLVWWKDNFMGAVFARSDGQAHWHNDQYGDIFAREIQEWNARPAPKPKPNTISRDFNATRDSALVPWVSFDGAFAIALGTDYLAGAMLLVDQGLEVEMTPAYLARAWGVGGKGTNRASTVAFRQGWNIRQAGSRVGHGPRRSSRALVRGSGPVFVEVTDGQTSADETAYGRREVGVDYQATADTAPLTRAGQKALAALRLASDGPPQFGVTSYPPASGSSSDGGVPPAKMDFLPFVDYDEGDTITLDIPGEYANVAKRIYAITIDEAPNGEAEVTLTLDSAPFDGTTAGGSPASGVGGGVGAHVHPPNPAICYGTTGGDLFLGMAEGSLKASGTEVGFERAKAVDGNAATRWSPPNNQGPAANHWWAADKGAIVAADSYHLVTATTDFASDLAIYGSNDPAAWSWLPAGKLVAEPTANGWVLVGGYADRASPIDVSGGFVPQAYRYWLFRCLAGGTGSMDEFDIDTVELFGLDCTIEPIGDVCSHGDSTEAAACDHAHAHGVHPTGDQHPEYVREAEFTASGDTLVGTGVGTLTKRKNNMAATSAPGVGDDSADGYTIGSRWLDTTNDHYYIATDVTVGAAVWLQLDGGAGHTIKEDGTSLTTRTGLNFGLGLVATDDAGNDETDVAADFGTVAGKVAEGNHAHAAGDSSKASATADLAATTGTAADVTGATLSLVAGTYIVAGNFDVTVQTNTDRQFEGILDVGGTDENDLAVLLGVGLDTSDRQQVVQFWRITLGAPATVKLQARHSGGTAGDFRVNAENTTLTVWTASGGSPTAPQRKTVAAPADVTIASSTIATVHSSLDITFTAPQSGRVMFIGAAVVKASALSDALFFVQLDSGGDNIMGAHQFDASATMDSVPLGFLFTGLTPGQSYVAHYRWRRDGTGTLTMNVFSRGGGQQGCWWMAVPLP